MNQLYEEVSKKLVDAIELYMNDKIELDALIEADNLEKLVYGYKEWTTSKEELKKRVFENTKKIYSEINEVESKIRKIDQMNQGKDFEVEVEGILAHAQLLGRNRNPPAGSEHSNWYVGPFPTIQMIQALKKEE